MLGACPNAWQTYGCEWIIGYLWRWTNLLERLALLGLALMFLHAVVVTVRVSCRYYSARRAEVTATSSQAFQRVRRELVAKLNLSVDSLKSVASTAPYLGLAGTCLGIMGMFRGFEGSTHDFFVIFATEIEAAFMSTAAGLLVAVPAIMSYHCLRALIDSLEPTSRKLGAVQRFPLAARFSKIPFAVIAAPVLALCIAGFMTFSSFRISKGLVVGIASAHCGNDDDRIITLRITDTGKLFLNAEQEDWNRVATRLSEIYKFRVDRTLYLFVEDDVPFQAVADALDIVETSSPKISVRLVTPSARTALCPGVRSFFNVVGTRQSLLK
jgi:biopolymer transport protein ExbB